MIFSRIFSPAYSHRDPQKRIQAIANLSPDKGNEKSVLHELAFNDENVSVSIAALEKLNSFPLWLKMSQTANDARLRRKANQQVENTLLDADSQQIPEQELSEYLIKQAPVELVRKVLKSPVAKNLPVEVVLRLLEKAAKGDFVQEYFLNHASPSIQLHIIACETQDSVLTRLFKKTENTDTKKHIEQRLAELKQEREKPVEVEKDTILLLSKLQAVTTKQDYHDVAARIAEYEAQYDELKKDFPLLAEDKQQDIIAKYDRLMAKAYGFCDQLKEKWEAQQASQRILTRYRETEQNWQAAQAKVSWLFQERLCDATLADVEAINDRVRELEDGLIQFDGTIDQQQYRQLKTSVIALATRLERFSAQQQIGKRVFQYLLEAEALKVKSDAEPEFDVTEPFSALRKQWREETRQLDTLPSAWKARWSQVEKHVKARNEAVNTQREKALKACRRLVSVITSLLEKGRFRSAMARFRELEDLYTGLDEVGQSKLSRRFTQVKEEITHLEGWQSYLAEPRKPALLAQAQALASEPADDIPKRSDTIKLLRQQWQSLSAGRDKDAQDEAFDAALEQAFAPCRAYYAEQEKQRQQNVLDREALIDEVCTLDMEGQDLAPVAKQLEKLKVQWREAGSVDKHQYEALRKRWDIAVAPVQERISQWYASNREQKQAIIQQAKALFEADGLEDKAAQAKALQQTWKKIGNAGRRYETKLWQVFKETNDQLFQALKNQQQAEQQQDDGIVRDLMAQLDGIQINDTGNDEDVQRVLGAINEKMQSLSKAKRIVLDKRIKKLRLDMENRAENIKYEAKKQQLSVLQQVVMDWADNSDVTALACFDAVEKNYQQAMTATVQDPMRSRPWYTAMLELLVSLPTPKEDEGLRREVQLVMLRDKLAHGEEARLAQALSTWLAYGQPSKGDAQRFHAILDEVSAQPALLMALN